MRTLILFLLVAAMALPAACGPRDDRYNPSHYRFTGVLAPPDVVLPKGADPASGLIPKTSGTAGACCWITKHARILVGKHVDAHSLRLTMYIPSVPLFEEHPQQLTIRCRGCTTFVSKPLGPGFHTIRIALPGSLRARRGTIPVSIDARIDYTPAPAAHYAVILLSVYFE